MTRIEIIKNKRKEAVLLSNSLGDVVEHAKVNKGGYRSTQEVSFSMAKFVLILYDYRRTQSYTRQTPRAALQS